MRLLSTKHYFDDLGIISMIYFLLCNDSSWDIRGNWQARIRRKARAPSTCSRRPNGQACPADNLQGLTHVPCYSPRCGWQRWRRHLCLCLLHDVLISRSLPHLVGSTKSISFNSRIKHACRDLFSDVLGPYGDAKQTNIYVYKLDSVIQNINWTMNHDSLKIILIWTKQICIGTWISQ